ncbi:MAG: UDP-N-acetylmuramoyl-L-alanyl-D-glutamate--2,6-diaminopimelate ligase [Candidatus Kaiserbacteria bacterium]|nr:UDP-N-acetylmuramoyl-L-alanyl-D-glutamate--2,6-diaminopimelate ligase [Candidatus Kaiserbacteria bacterium]
MEKLLKTLKFLIPTSLFKALQPLYHSTLAVVGALWYQFPSRKLYVVGITGTNGKTTTATLLYKIATALGYKAGLISTVENVIAGEVRHTTHTTPDPISLNKIFRDMVNAGCTHVFMEVSSHALDQNRVMGVHFVGGIFTNLTHDHLDYHKTFENYFEAKKKFFRMLPAGTFALSNTDSAFGNKMLEGIKANAFSYGFSGNENFHGEIKEIKREGLDLIFNGVDVHSTLLGEFNAYNLLAAWSACTLLGFDMEKVNLLLKDIEPPTGRFQHFTSSNGVLVIVDYAHTPDALENVLKTIRASFADSKVISIFGCGGDRDPMKRELMGHIGAQLSDIAIFTSDNPRGEDPETVIEQMKTSLSSEDVKKVKTISNRRDAILEGIRLAQKGDIILCAGKGHEDYQEIKGIKYHFNDMEEFKKAFGGS